MSDYRGGYRTEVPRYELILKERKEYEEYIKTHELTDLAGKIERGEPHDINTSYGGYGFVYFYPKSTDLGKIKG